MFFLSSLAALAKQHGRLTATQAEELTEANRATIKLHLSKLVKEGHLAQHGAGRGTWYSASEQ